MITTIWSKIHLSLTLLLVIFVVYVSYRDLSEGNEGFLESRDAIITYHLIEDRLNDLTDLFDNEIIVSKGISSWDGPYFSLEKPTGWSNGEQRILRGVAGSVLHLFHGTPMSGRVAVEIDYLIKRSDSVINIPDGSMDGNDLPNVAVLMYRLGVDPYEGSMLEKHPIIPLESIRDIGNESILEVQEADQ